MATAKELGIQPGDTAFIIQANRVSVGANKSIFVFNCPLDTPGAELNFTPVHIEEITSTGWVKTKRIGQDEDKATVWPGFDRFFSEVDRKMGDEMRRAGVRIQVTRTPNNEMTYKLVRTVPTGLE